MTTDDSLLGAPYRPVRTVRAKEDAPWPGVLAREADGAMRLLVDADQFGDDWGGWDADPHGHVLAPVDVARRRDGHDVVLPVCVERLDDFLRRRAARLPLTAGEAVTLGVSLLRGCAQLVARPDTVGEWWLDDGGRPVLATEASPSRARDAAAEAMASLELEPALRRTWDIALRAVAAERLSATDLTAAEDALFALATPEPLGTTILGPRAAAEVATAARADRGAPEPEAPRSLWQTLVHGVDADLADSVSQATTAVWRRWSGRRADAGEAKGSRRMPWIVGGAVAAAVLAAGALWPGGGPATADGSGGPATGAAPTTSATSGSDVVDASGGEAMPASTADAPADLAADTGALLDARLACAGDEACLSDVAVDPRAVARASGAIDLTSSERTVTLLDDFGDVAVLRVDAADGGAAAQLVVIVRIDEKWLLRDVHDVAQQP
ncbi:hypothetical protein JNB62_13425 [Microbacterium jejuense]|uniref:Uncharacterized protein n=1 Tax=Microbacterium jejuense TaxID=1263637 RepID=A0ABS7HR43_9MICO|nr:hypothetical protein [Microbacterium jejuense]MBW9094692.1 hypothetical protein [Microbacterium jejuense]